MGTKEWLTAIGALSLSLNSSSQAQQPDTETRAGVASAVNTTASGVMGGATRTLFIGNDVFRDEHIATDANGRAQLLFLDQSAVTVGPNAQIIIDRFVYDPKTRLGTLSVQASQGLLRFVGGDLSKQQDVVVRTPTMLIGIRGGISLINVDQNGGTQAIFMFGNQLTATATQGGQTVVINRPGFGVTSAPGQPLSEPARVSATQISNLLAQLEAPTPAGATPTGLGPGPTPAQIAPDRTLNQLRAFSGAIELYDLGTGITRQSTQQGQRRNLSQS
ncbi:MAG TPA: FecR domain-containing protein [Candidatus Sulfotelmatobacter sp.]|nr:FecR domain-containing protein [Candidatus Sulfotelmatobacter sp.]